jgi:hypothetical protein
MKLNVIFLFLILLFSLNYSFSSHSPLRRNDSELSEELDSRSPILKTFASVGFEETGENKPKKQETNGKKTKGKKGFFRRSDSPSPSASDSEEAGGKKESILNRRRGGEWTIKSLDSALESSDVGTPPSVRRHNTKLNLEEFTESARKSLWGLMKRLEKEESTAEKRWDRLQQEIASATSV